MAKILQVNYRFPKPFKDVLKEQIEKNRGKAVEGAKHIATISGLRWKIYLQNPEKGEVGGIYLFEDEASLKAYLDGPIMTQRKQGQFGDGKHVVSPIVDVTIKQFDIMDEFTKITRGPI
jgi:hypothetical protein